MKNYRMFISLSALLFSLGIAVLAFASQDGYLTRQANPGIHPSRAEPSAPALTFQDLLATPSTVNTPGDYQLIVGCTDIWLPDCPETTMTAIGNGNWANGPFALPAGDYEVKVALNGTWDENYGLGGEQDGPNIPFSLAQDGVVSFIWNEQTKLLTVIEGMVNVPGDYQPLVGCADIWLPDCLQTVMIPLNDIYWRSGPFLLPAGNYESKVALNGTWDENCREIGAVLGSTKFGLV